MNRKQKIIVSITGIFIVLLALVGLTYAYFLTRITGNENEKSIEVTTANLSVTYNDDMDGDGEPDALMVFENIMPSNTVTYTKTFKVENTGNATASYSVVLDNMVNDFDRNQDLQYTLTREGVVGNVSSGNLVVGTRQILLPKAEIENEEIHTYTLTLKYIEAGVDQSIDMGKELSFRVNIEEETVTWDTATNGTLLYAIKSANNISTTMSSLEDDYGTSYYYKGVVTNNYINYSGMCWRIVRVQGDGSIKMALLYKDICENFASATIEEKDLSENFISMGEFNYGSISYKESNIPILIADWVEANNLNTSKLVETDFCNDTSIAEEKINYLNDNWFDVEPNDATFVWYRSYYGANVREQNNSYTFKCNMRGIDGTKATRIKTQVALLSRDEYKLGGDYLIDKDLGPGEGVGYLDWTMSPSYHYIQDYSDDDLNSDELKVYVGQGQEEIYNLSYMFARPVVVLKSDVMLDKNISGQNGTEMNPYQVK